MINREWMNESLPKTPSDTDNDNCCVNNNNKIENNVIIKEEEEEEEELEEFDIDVDIDVDIDDYGSDNDDINSDDELYDLIDIDSEINIEYLTIENINNFHTNLFKYYDNTRSSYNTCKSRYDILCMINDIWQQILIERELDKLNLTKDGNYIKKERIIYDKNIKYEPYKLDDTSNEWLTPCSSPKKEIKIVGSGGLIIYNKIIPSASIFGSIS